MCIRDRHERAVQEHKFKKVQEKLEDFGIKVVFTAHPTQFYPNSVQRILHDLRTAISVSYTHLDVYKRQLMIFWPENLY